MMSLADDEVAWPDDAVEVARVVDAWGIKGGLKVVPYAAKPEALFSTKRWFLQPPEQRVLPAGAAFPRLLRIVTAKAHGEGVVATAREVPDRNAAEALKGARIFVSRASFPTAAADEYYWVDLLGLDVFNREQQPLGRVADLLDTGAHSVLRLEYAGPDGKTGERLIPFVAAYVDAVDLPGRRIQVDWGLDY
jgi:16S rRNA processing protein RimM